MKERYKDLKDGTYEFTYDSGKIESEITIKNGNFEGFTKGYYENGNKKYFGEYKNSKPHSLWTTWYESGVKESSGMLKNGKKVGWSKIWYENGQKKFLGFFKDDKLIRRSKKEWNEDGSVKE